MSLRRSHAKERSVTESRRGTWSVEEDQVIIDCISQGFSKWSDIGKKIPNERTGKQCRERWFNHLDPQLKKEPWTDEEDQALIEAQKRLGNSWTRIATELPGRSENEVKNRWYSAAIRNKHIRVPATAAGQKRRLEPEKVEAPERKNSEMTVVTTATTQPYTPLRLPSIIGVHPNGELPPQLLLSSRSDHPGDITSPESTQLPPGESHSLGSGLTTPLSFLGGALSGFNSGTGSPAWVEGSGVGGTSSSATAITTGSAGSDGDTVAEALRMLLQGITTLPGTRVPTPALPVAPLQGQHTEKKACKEAFVVTPAPAEGV